MVKVNLVYYHTKHHSIQHHEIVQMNYVYVPNIMTRNVPSANLTGSKWFFDPCGNKPVPVSQNKQLNDYGCVTFQRSNQTHT